jgi:hypothetical protein
VVGVKYHPREWTDDYLQVRTLPGVVLLPRGLAMEYVYLLSDDRLKWVIGDNSTAMMTARWLSPGAQVVAFIGSLIDPNEALVNCLAKLGVSIASNQDQLKASLEGTPVAN